MRVYLDHNATTPPCPEARAAVERVLCRSWGNPSSPHAEGAQARAEVEAARVRVAALLGARPADVLFTAGATEANNTALRGLAELRGPTRGSQAGRCRAVTSAVEHPSVEAPLARLESEGWRVTRVPVDADGLLEREAFAAALAEEPAFVSLLWANNETGVVQPLEELAAAARARGVPLHVDATQVVGKLPVDLSRLPVDWISLSAHKLGGPKGVGCLVGPGELPAIVHGGPQEAGRRGGTENVPGIAGLGAACERARGALDAEAVQRAALRDRLWEGIVAKIPRVRRNGSVRRALPNTLNVEFTGAAGELLLQALDLEGFAVSAGAACASGAVTPSHVLLAMGRSPAQARASLRFSLGAGNDAAQIDHLLSLLPDLVARARAAGDV